MNPYIMKTEGEPERVRSKTSTLRIRRHLDWVGLAAGDRFADFGCASGEVIREAARIVRSGRVVGVDGDPDMLSFARAESERLGLRNVRYEQAWVGPEPTPLAADSFDHAWTRFFLEYQPDPVSAIREMVRVVRPGGRVSLLDLDGNCIWHHPLPEGLREPLDEVIRDLAKTGFDPRIGVKLAGYAAEAGLCEIRQSIEPYHSIVGQPDARTAEAWRRKLLGIKESYVRKLFPEKAWMASFFDELLDFILRPDTTTWSLLYLVQGSVRA